MTLLKKPEDVLPLLMGICGLVIVYLFPLFHSDTIIVTDKYAVYKIIGLNTHSIKIYADIFNRCVIGGIILYILFLYRHYLQSMTLITSIFLTGISVFYMGLLANVVLVPPIDFFSLCFLSIALWHFCFLRKQNLLSLLVATSIFVLIAFFNPVASIFLSGALMITEKVISLFDKQKERAFYNIIFILLCGFCSLTFSLLKSKNIHTFADLMSKNYHLSIMTSCLLIILVICSEFSKTRFMQECEHHKKAMIFAYSVITFLGATCIGRFDYMAHFV